MSWKDRQQQEFRDADAENLSYDFFKFFSSTSILAIGGLLTLSQSVFSENIESWQMLAATFCVAGAGIIAAQCQHDIVQISRGSKRAGWTLRIGHVAVPTLFGAGIASFLVFIARGMS